MIDWLVRKFYRKEIEIKERRADDSARRIDYLLDELEKRDRQLSEQNLILQGMLDSQLDLLVHIGIDNKITWCNNAYKLTFGLTDEELQEGVDIASLIHPDDIEDSAKHWQQVTRSPFRIRHVQRAKTVAGYKYFEWEGWALFDPSGRQMGFGGSGRDVTDRIHAEHQIQHLMDDYETLLNGVPVFLWYVPAINIMGPCNKAFAEFFGLKDGESLAGKSLTDLMPTEQVNICIEANKKVFETGEPVTTREWVTRHDGEKRLWLITKTPKKNGKVRYAVACGLDITEYEIYGKGCEYCTAKPGKCYKEITV